MPLSILHPAVPAHRFASRLRPVALSTALALGMLAAAVSPFSEARAQDKSDAPVPAIRVQGEGVVAVAPDMALVNLSVLREGETARGALDENNAAMAEVLKAMKDEGIADKDLQTGSFSIQPRYTQPPRNSDGESEAPRIAGYQVSNTLSVRLRDLARLGAVLDRAVSLGVNAGGDITFTNAETGPIVERARAAAMKDAAARAKTLAEAAGVTLGPILEISENYSSSQPMPMARGKAIFEMAADSVPVAGGESTYSVTVNAAWRISQ